MGYHVAAIKHLMRARKLKFKFKNGLANDQPLSAKLSGGSTKFGGKSLHRWAKSIRQVWQTSTIFDQQLAVCQTWLHSAPASTKFGILVERCAKKGGSWV
jgi:hypothetical protein